MSAVLRAKIAAIIITNFIFELLCFLEYFYCTIKLLLETQDFSAFIYDGFMLLRALCANFVADFLETFSIGRLLY